jgi:hypothetical protein
MADNDRHDKDPASGTGRDGEAAELRAGIVIAVLAYLVVLILGFVWVVRG